MLKTFNEKRTSNRISAKPKEKIIVSKWTATDPSPQKWMFSQTGLAQCGATEAQKLTTCIRYVLVGKQRKGIGKSWRKGAKHKHKCLDKGCHCQSLHGSLTYVSLSQVSPSSFPKFLVQVQGQQANVAAFSQVTAWRTSSWSPKSFLVSPQYSASLIG